MFQTIPGTFAHDVVAQQAEGFSFDVLDSTNIVPEELVPLTLVATRL